MTRSSNQPTTDLERIERLQRRQTLMSVAAFALPAGGMLALLLGQWGPGAPAADTTTGQLREIGQYLLIALSAGLIGAYIVGQRQLTRAMRDLRRAEPESREVSSSAAPSAADLQTARAAAPSAIPHPPPTVAEPSAAHWHEVLTLLRDVRDNTLLAEPERRAKAARVEQDEFAEADSRLKRLAHDGEFEAAFEHLAELGRRYPGRPTLTSLEAFLERARADRERQDLAAFTKRIEDLVSISAWERAREALAELRHRYPESAAIAPLETRIEREYELYEDAQRQRMYAEIQRFVNRRRWAEALAAAHTFIERFPHHSEADALRLQLETLANNAQVTARQEMEAEITELAKRGQYAEAEILARQAIDQWPDSPQAEILRSQLDRLHELATNPNAPPPRVRPSGAY